MRVQQIVFLLFFLIVASFAGDLGHNVTCTFETEYCDCTEVQACIKGLCGPCFVDSECGEDICRNGKCTHKNLLPNINWQDFLGTVCFAIGGAMAAAGGIGGGGIFVPLLIILMGFEPHDAVPISSGLIFAGSITAFIWNSRKKHPLVDRPVIDLLSVLYLEPPTLVGTTVGIITNRIMSPIVLVIFVTLFLIVASIRTLRTGLNAWGRESALKHHDVAEHGRDRLITEGGEPALIGEDAIKDDSDVEMEDEAVKINPLLKALIDSEKTFPMKIFMVLIAVWVGFIGINIVKGLSLPCGLVYWLLFASIFVFVGIVSINIYRFLRRDHDQKEALGYHFQEGDIKWRASTAMKYPIGFFVAGFIAGFAGIGGGMVIGPLLLELGMIPQVASATSYTFVLFTSSATTAQFLIIGALRFDYAIWFGIVCAVFVIVGQFFIQKLVKKYNRQSIIIFLVFVILVIATAMLAGRGVMDIESGVRCGNIPGFRKLC